MQLLEARVSLCNVNFGDASKHFEEAKPALRRVRERFQNIGKNAAAGDIAAALEHIEEGQRLAGKLDQAANSKANDALEAIHASRRRNSSLLQNRCRQLHRHLALHVGSDAWDTTTGFPDSTKA